MSMSVDSDERVDETSRAFQRSVRVLCVLRAWCVCVLCVCVLCVVCCVLCMMLSICGLYMFINECTTMCHHDLNQILSFLTKQDASFLNTRD